MDPNNQNSTQPVSFDDKIDMSAFSEAINATAGTKSNVPSAIDVNQITLENTPTTGAELDAQMNQNPGMNLGGTTTTNATASTTPNSATASTSAASATSSPAIDAPTNPNLATQQEAMAIAGEITNGSLSGEVSPDSLEDDEAIESSLEAGDLKKDEKGITIDKESEVNETAQAISNASAKAQDSAKKALNAIKPKSTIGVVVAAIVVGFIVIALTIGILFLVLGN